MKRRDFFKLAGAAAVGATFQFHLPTGEIVRVPAYGASTSMLAQLTRMWNDYMRGETAPQVTGFTLPRSAQLATIKLGRDEWTKFNDELTPLMRFTQVEDRIAPFGGPMLAFKTCKAMEMHRPGIMFVSGVYQMPAMEAYAQFYDYTRHERSVRVPAVWSQKDLALNPIGSDNYRALFASLDHNAIDAAADLWGAKYRGVLKRMILGSTAA